jgi:hypothetical protein
VSAIACLLLVRYLPHNRKQALIWLSLIGVGLIGFWLVRTGAAVKATLVQQNRDGLEGFIGQFALAQYPLTPSHWMTMGVMAAARNEPGDALRALALLWSNGNTPQSRLSALSCH